jgi:hypothetical protein
MKKYFIVEDSTIIKIIDSHEEAYKYINEIEKADPKRVQFHEFDIICGRYI